MEKWGLKQELVQIPCGPREQGENSWTKSCWLNISNVEVTETGTFMYWAAMRTAEKYWQRDLNEELKVYCVSFHLGWKKNGIGCFYAFYLSIL